MEMWQPYYHQHLRLTVTHMGQNPTGAKAEIWFGRVQNVYYIKSPFRAMS